MFLTINSWSRGLVGPCYLVCTILCVSAKTLRRERSVKLERGRSMVFSSAMTLRWLVVLLLVVPSYEWSSFKLWLGIKDPPPVISQDESIQKARVTTSCGGEIQNNLTYVTNPGFPNLIDQPMNCSIAIKKVEPQVSQLRIDFLHFNIGQPNRRTGVCDQDRMEVITGNKTFQLCGWNSGQHIYMDVTDGLMSLDFRLPNTYQSRMWEIRVSQLGFEQRAPAGCLQYFESPSGVLKTLNYLPNGRFLAEHDHLLCVRQAQGMCSISYTPCTADSFRIGPPRVDDNDQSEGSGTGPEPDTASKRCRDRVLIPCDFEEFITPGNDGAGICNLEHCGSSLCSPTEVDEDGSCRVETSATPFHIRVAFGPGEDTGISPENNAGMCLSYEQLPCSP
ncbi:uncharacterized protein LOC107269457 isoform X2 [Cephus cinctus]|uniref:Uncharacterized protein LOC107269457 isoform X2 n=1 Tax=Cephus cinctus TaxID=211228 RepID=A0AAJ7FM96_CEPCN|nr:uncharacterized protein LOC107269457 isoform X2 [Cephus cinctus]